MSDGYKVPLINNRHKSELQTEQPPTSPIMDSTVFHQSLRTKPNRPIPISTSFNQQPKLNTTENQLSSFVEDESYLTSLMSSFSFFSESSESKDGSPPPPAPPSPPSSPSPNSTVEHPGCSADDMNILVVTPTKKVRCTGCGVRVTAAEAVNHVCNLSELFSRCSHCGEKIPLLEASIHWCDGASKGKSIEPQSPPLVEAITNTASSTTSTLYKSAVDCANYSQAVGNAAVEYTAYSGSVAGAVAAASAVEVVTSIAQNAVSPTPPWLLRIGYDLAAAPSMSPGREVPFESDLMKGSVFVALKRDENLEPATHASFFEGKGRTVQVQWSVTLKRKLKGPLFIGFESNPSHLTGSLPGGTMQSGLISALSMFHGKKDLHLNLPQHRKPINTDNDWGLGVVGHKALVSFFETLPGETLPRLDRPLESKLKCINFENMIVGHTYSFCWYTQYVEFTDMTLVNVPMLGRVMLPFNAIRCVLYEHLPSSPKNKPTRALSPAEMKNPTGAVRMINKKAKARAGVDKLSETVGDYLEGRMVVVLAHGVSSDGTDRVRVRGPGVCRSVVPCASSSKQSDGRDGSSGGGDEVEEVKESGSRRRKVVAELDAWISASLLDNPARDKLSMGNTEDRTYGFSCIFATR